MEENELTEAQVLFRDEAERAAGREYLYVSSNTFSKCYTDVIRHILSKFVLMCSDEDIIDYESKRNIEILSDFLIIGDPDEVAKTHGVSRERVRQVIRKVARRAWVGAAYPVMKKRVEEAEAELQWQLFMRKLTEERLCKEFGKKHKCPDHPDNPILLKRVDDPSLRLSFETLKRLAIADITYVFQLTNMTASELLAYRNFGKKAFSELESVLESNGLKFKAFKGE